MQAFNALGERHQDLDLPIGLTQVMQEGELHQSCRKLKTTEEEYSSFIANGVPFSARMRLGAILAARAKAWR
jgi:hypothetical protein